jgi:hypothetical protein
MKKIILLSLLVLEITAKGQITLEHIYDHASNYNSPNSRGSQLMIINFELSGQKYVKIDKVNKAIKIYDLTHNLINTISLANVPFDYYGSVEDILYISQTLFNTDPKIEFMYVHSFNDAGGNGNFLTNIYNEDGTLIFSDTSVALIKINFEQQQYPIYNTSRGTKMILSCVDGNAKVFSLPGTLSCNTSPCGGLITEIKETTSDQYNDPLSNPYPNPAITTTTINYLLPDDTNSGEIVFFDNQGKEAKRFRVDKTFTNLQLSTNDIAPGTYYYQLLTPGKTSSGKKLVVIK